MQEFIPLHELIERKPGQLTSEQQKVVTMHKLASQLHDNVEAWKQHRKLTAQQREAVARLEKQAEEAGQLAVTTSVGYYIKNGRLEDSYEDVRKVAGEHWSRKINSRWAKFFTNAFAHHYNAGRIDASQLSNEFVALVDRGIQTGALVDRLTKMLRRDQGTGGKDVKTDLGHLQRRAEIAEWIRESEKLGKQTRTKREHLPN